jgi:hypothetical protein
VRVQFQPVDVERNSGADRTPLGAERHGLGRVAAGQVDWATGDATDFWSVDVEQGGPILCFLLLDQAASQVRLDGFAPGAGSPVVSVANTGPRRLFVGRATVPAGRLLVRVRHSGGPPSAYSLFLFPAEEDPEAMVAVVRQLVVGQGARASAYLRSREFAADVRSAFVVDAELDEAQLAGAFLAGLGEEVSESRQLVLQLLHAHFRPTLAALDQVRRDTPDDRRGRDAALLVAQRCTELGGLKAYVRAAAELDGVALEVFDPGPNRDPVTANRIRRNAKAVARQAILDAARDDDAHVRLRALTVASRWREPELRTELKDELRRLLSKEPSAMVKRALEAAFPHDASQ